MKPADHRISVFIITACILASCGTPTPPPPIEVVPGQVNTGNKNLVNLQINSVQFLGKVSNYSDAGKLQLITVVADDAGHADALICPYGGIVTVHQGDNINPCQAGVSYPDDYLKDHLYVVLIAVDVKDSSALVDIGVNGLSTALGYGIEQALRAAAPEAVAAGGAWAVVGFLALDTILGYAGSKVQNYFQKNYVIGSQSFSLSRQYNWNNGEPISAQSTNGQVNFTFEAQKSTTETSPIVEVIPTSAPLTETTQGNSSAGNQVTRNFYDMPEDGEVLNRFCKEDWETCRSVAVSDANWQDINVASVGGGSFPDGYLIERTFLFFDTSAIPVSATIQNATLYMYAGKFLNGNTTIHVVASNANPPLSTSSFQKFSNKSGGSVTLTTPFDWGSITLSNSALAWIIPNGITKLALIHDNDLYDRTPSEQNDVVISTGEDTVNRPYLEITYTVP